ncbi:myosin heavy chain, striated muscle-like [Eucalyptus grandis]|uniref:myosin heavy chain, striated muscle-like n=1 Tax=Eucalyptus grandis TaxID=71139 RepID=UPI00192E7606|nr:myosin heavy chain, striated muscle-like [Eucalyptus grandis]
MIGKQKLELENVAFIQSKFSDMEDSLLSNIAENKNLKTQLQQTKESEKDLLAKLQQMEKAFEDEKPMMDEKVGLEKRLFEFEREYTSKLSEKEEEIVNLEAKLTKTLEEKHSQESADRGDEYLIKEIETLKEKVQELETDCNELTEENLDLLFKLKKLNNCLHVATDCRDGQKDNVVNGMLVANEKSNECLKMDAEDKGEEFGKESVEDGNKERKVKEMLLLKEEEINNLRECHTKLEALVSDLQKEKTELEEKLQIMQRESEVTAKCLTDVQNDLVVLSGSVDSHVSANKMLERESSEIGPENVALSMRIAEQEVQLSYLMDEMEATQLELERSRALCESLDDEISKLSFSSKKQKTQLEKEMKEMQNRWSEAQEECDHLKKERAQLQADVESLAEECNSLQELNGKLKMQNVELHEELRSCLSGCSTKVETLEENLSALLDDVTAKERTFKSEIDALLDENREQKERLAVGESILNQIYADKTTEVENLRKEIEHLTNQISDIHNERERIVSDAAEEISKLCADKAELELALCETRSELQRKDCELNQEIEHLTNQISDIHDERERIVSDAAEEISKLCADKAELELALRETQSELQRKDRELNEMQAQYERQVNDLIEELSASQEDRKALQATEQRLSKLLENHKSREEKLRTNINELELRLTVCEYDRQRLMDESTNMKAHVQQFENLHDQLSVLKIELTETKRDKEGSQSFAAISIQRMYRPEG